MLSVSTQKEKNRVIKLIGLLLVGFIFIAPSVFAQSASSQNSAPATSTIIPPPIGSFDASGKPAAPSPVIPGDIGTPPTPPIGNSSNSNLSRGVPGFTTQPNSTSRPIIHIYKNTTSKTSSGTVSHGLREVMVIRPDQLSNDQNQLTQIESILGVSPTAGGADIFVTANDTQLQAVQNILAPYPLYSFDTVHGSQHKYISTDSPGYTYFSNPSNPQIQGGKIGHAESIGVYRDALLPTVYTWSRYLVILGVVFATLFMAWAAWGVVRGERDAGSKVVATASGLMLLLMAYTIYKVVRMNITHTNSTNDATYQRPNPTSGLPSLQHTNMPAVPTTARTQPARSGLPLTPDGSAH